MEDGQRDVFDRALEFLGGKWLERHGIQGYAARSVCVEQEKAPPDGAARHG